MTNFLLPVCKMKLTVEKQSWLTANSNYQIRDIEECMSTTSYEANKPIHPFPLEPIPLSSDGTSRTLHWRCKECPFIFTFLKIISFFAPLYLQQKYPHNLSNEGIFLKDFQKSQILCEISKKLEFPTYFLSFQKLPIFPVYHALPRPPFARQSAKSVTRHSIANSDLYKF